MLVITEAISKQAINAVMPYLFRYLSINGKDQDQSGKDDYKYFEIASNTLRPAINEKCDLNLFLRTANTGMFISLVKGYLL